MLFLRVLVAFMVVLCSFLVAVCSGGGGGGGETKGEQTGALLLPFSRQIFFSLGILLFFWRKCLTGISLMCYYINNDTERKGEQGCE